MKINKLVTIIGAGPAGIGTATALLRLGIEDIQVIDKGEIGQSFLDWNTKTRFISPSFNTNGFGFPDMNAITPDTSPGYYADSEHLSGESYAEYLTEVAQYFNVPVSTNEMIEKIEKQENGYIVYGEFNTYHSTYLITALGDVSYPDQKNISGYEYGLRYTELGDYTRFADQEEVAIIGGNESGFDAAIQLAKMNIKSTIYTSNAGIDSESSDPSQSLSLYTRERYREVADFITIYTDIRIKEITTVKNQYILISEEDETFSIPSKPIIATGFSNVQSPLIENLFDIDEDRAVLNLYDESTISKNLFMVGSQVEHDGVILCFIYKYRQRFAYIANEIARRASLPVNPLALQLYKDYQMFLEDLSCCDTDCAC
ncbi:NAD(P)/FAD-dependent oxidoreductase [Marinilactibacillus sp. XAAS-LB27]|uniref:NAD(P)/FAD-dependent oxidoreductase n=1 Tax=Marinilactibacillus sp. XAAS-LB27 TaxID=3114538 RepID=UPI002E1805F5|nr:NAD(P)/FAD-dependent oxidoreductase [Marinilactibacillus sp. XAAS-LB27]